MGTLLNICSAIDRFIKGEDLNRPETPTANPVTPVHDAPPAFPDMHPGLTDQQLVVLLTAVAYEVTGSPVRIKKIRPLMARDWNWVSQGRNALQSHSLK